MTTRITGRGRVTVPERMRKALQLSPGDEVEFRLNDRGKLVLRKVSGATAAKARSSRARLHPRLEEQRRRHAAELLALLRGLD
jgi:AbrB family looped-hinge helix DNA binding protein